MDFLQPKDSNALEWYEKCNKLIYPEPFAKFGPEKVSLPFTMKSILEEIQNFKVLENDIWFVSYPKSGTTWVEEIVWLLLNELDFVKAKKISINLRCPYLERQNSNPSKYDSISWEKLPHPRLIKTHLPLSLLPREIQAVKPKIIYVARDPKEICVSTYHHAKGFDGYLGTSEDFTKAFMSGNCKFSPFWSHLKGLSELRNERNVLFLTFTELKQDLNTVIRKICIFLNQQYPESHKLDQLIAHVSANQMSKNPSVNYSDIFLERQKILGIQESGKFIQDQHGKKKLKDMISGDLFQAFENWTARDGFMFLGNK